jgi:hypothetical protein
MKWGSTGDWKYPLPTASLDLPVSLAFAVRITPFGMILPALRRSSS